MSINRQLSLSEWVSKWVTVKHLSEQFTDDEFERLRRGKGDRSWREALLDELAEEREDTDGRDA